MSQPVPDPTSTTPLPSSIRDRIKREADMTAAREQAAPAGADGHPLLARLKAIIADTRTRLRGAAPTEAPTVAATDAAPDEWAGVLAKLKAKAGALPLPRVAVPPGVTDELIDRGRRAGLQIGTALDRIVRELPKTRAVEVPAPRAGGDDDVSTVAVRAAVKQPSIFAPTHILTALLAGGVIHIATTFAITALGSGSAWRTLRPVLPANAFVVMPPQVPGAQVLPFLTPDMLYAFCRFDLKGGGVEISAQLPEAGWSLALYTRQGDNFYATPGVRDRPIPVNFVLVPASDRLLDLTPGRRKSDVDVAHVTSPDGEGLAVIRAPLKGIAFEPVVQAQLKAATCRARK
jgi:uncharacterized membrane protein